MAKVQEISREAVERSKAAVDGLAPDEGHGEIERILSRQELLFRFLTEAAGEISPAAVELVLYLGIVVYHAYEATYPGGLAQASDPEIRAAREKSARWAESHAPTDDPLAGAPAGSDDPFPQPHVIAHLLECLQETEAETLAVTADDRVELFLLLKTFVDVLDRVAAKPAT